MSRRAAALLVGAVAVLAALALAWWLAAGRQPADAPRIVDESPDAGGPVEVSVAELYFPNTAGWLGAESRELPAAASGRERAAQVVAAILAGPGEPGLRSPLGDGVELGSLHLSGDGVVYVDLAAPQQATPPVSGSRGELLAVYSFVNSVLANLPEARGVVLLWNGNQRPTFAGHVDTTRPLPPDSTWLARR